MSSSLPMVVAHRGASAYEPEHTLAAYRRALDQGADAVECDVRLTADGHLVCVHDRTVRRTSNGRGLVSTLELTQLEGLDWGAWKRLASGDAAQPFVVEPGDRAHLLTLRTLLALVRDCGRDVRVAVETKHPTRWGGLIERRLAALLDEFGWARPATRADARVRVMSFSLLALRRMRQLTPGVPLVLLMDRVPRPFRDGALPRGVDVAGIGVHVLRAHPGYVARVHAHGGQVHVWTVDEPDDVRRCLEAGVDAMISNRPAEVRREALRIVTAAEPSGRTGAATSGDSSTPPSPCH